MNGLDYVLLALGVAFLVPASLRWLRVAQREHYIEGWVTRMAWLWLARRPLNAMLFVASLALIVGTILVDWRMAIAMVSAPLAIILAGLVPIGLRVKGSSSPLKWTDRSKRLIALYALLVAIVVVLLSWWLGALALAAALLFAPLLMDLTLIPVNAIEKRLSNKYLVSARKRLDQVKPTVVAITGSYGKTSTKGYVAHVLDGAFNVVASPASFNNLMGLSRAVNDRVVPGTEVFIAEMGVYGPGDIRELSKTFPPGIAAITVIGEAHLARMGSREVIAAAKAEITEQAKTVVLPIDQPELARLAEKCRSQGKTVITVSTQPGTEADVVVDAAGGEIVLRGASGSERIPVTVPEIGHAVNIAVTVGIAVALKVPAATIAAKLEHLPGSQHRAEVQHSQNGVLVIDDTYNSNPVGAERALEGAAALAAEREGQLVVVTPGMVELGKVQFERNSAFAVSAVARGARLLAVGRTNRDALVAGASEGKHPVLVFNRREDAVKVALDLAGERGVILYENDLPDHFP